MEEKKIDEQTEEKATDEKPETKSENSEEGSKLETTPLLERARKEREGLEAQNDRKEKLLEREEAMMLRQALSGRAEAGQGAKEKSEDEKWAEGAKERYDGTGMSPVEDDDGK